MKKIVPRLLIVSSQILIGALFLIFTIEGKDEKSFKVNSRNLDKLSEVVYKETKSVKATLNRQVLNTYTGKLTGYGPDCYGCGNYKTNKVSTASGYHIANIVNGSVEPAFTITYDDYEFGEVRIVAADKTIPYYSIVRITIPNQEPFLAVVLDRGSTVGFSDCRSKKGCLTNFDLLFNTEGEAMGKTNNVLFEVLRIGE